MAIYKELDVYKRSYRLAIEVHHLSFTLPKNLQYDLADQIRRSSRSIPSDIAEGYSRNQSIKDTVVFLKRALGSVDEVLFNFEFLHDTNYISSEKYNYFLSEYTICGKQLTNLLRSLSKTKLPDN